MDPKQQALRNKQRERHDRGQDFQEEIKRSWRLVPNIWTLPIQDGRGGSKPADRLVITENANYLTELKRTEKKEFQLDFLRPNQIRGLIDFDQVITKNIGLVLVSFHDLRKGIDEAYAIRLTTALRYMQQKGRRSIPLEELRKGVILGATTKVSVKIPRLPAGDPTYDLQGVLNCYKYL
ncbi:hypothetical protein [Cytobacillus praedii]|uniref:hypothetical protein n=1 Tax=Cytobacillus praedii TaxID=1742358 RepID=UPI002E1F4598|nr:hypothetical protein [Cytobacillus praedii]